MSARLNSGFGASSAPLRNSPIVITLKWIWLGCSETNASRTIWLPRGFLTSEITHVSTSRPTTRLPSSATGRVQDANPTSRDRSESNPLLSRSHPSIVDIRRAKSQRRLRLVSESLEVPPNSLGSELHSACFSLQPLATPRQISLMSSLSRFYHHSIQKNIRRPISD